MIETLLDILNFILFWVDMRDDDMSASFFWLAFFGGMGAAVAAGVVIFFSLVLVRRAFFPKMHSDRFFDWVDHWAGFIEIWVRLTIPLTVPLTLLVLFLGQDTELAFHPIKVALTCFLVLQLPAPRIHARFMRGEIHGVIDVFRAIGAEIALLPEAVLNLARWPYPGGRPEALRRADETELAGVLVTRWRAALGERKVSSKTVLTQLWENRRRHRALREILVILSGQDDPDARALARVFSRFRDKAHEGYALQLVEKASHGNVWAMRPAGGPA